MLLRALFWPALALCAAGAVHAAEQAAWPGWELKSHIQTGVDVWHIDHSPNDPNQVSMALMPDSLTRWTHRDVSPWYTLESQLRMGTTGAFVLKGQANAARGAKLNQLSYDHFISPYLGLRVGVLDYRATWCRTYDLDNPWVREADPFCSNSVVSLPTDSAPAVQAYTNLEVKGYWVQAMVGSYHPKAFGYAPQEFSDFRLPPTAQVTHNHKVAMSVNVVNPATSTEWRLSLINTRQSLFDSDAEPGFPGGQVPINYHHRGRLWFAGVSWHMSPKLQTRLTYMDSDLTGRCEWITIQLGRPCVQHYRQQSVVAEMNYHLDERNVLSMALTHYPSEQINEVPVRFSAYKYQRQSVSVGWRKDWSARVFTAVQLTHAQYDQPYRVFAPPGFQGPMSGKSTGFGLRLGYKL